MKIRIEIVVEPSPEGFMAEAWQLEPKREMLMAVRDYSTAQSALIEILADLRKKAVFEILNLPAKQASP